MRRKIQRALPEEKRDMLKGMRWILVKNREKLSAEEEARLTKLLASHPELRELYLLKEEFRCIFEKVRSRDKASQFLKAWVYKAQMTGNLFLLRFVGTLKNWWNEILNYFVERVTNGFVEGLNKGVTNK